VVENSWARPESFSITDASAVTLAPAEKGMLPLGAGSVDVWNVDGAHWVAPVQCTDLFDFTDTLAWRRPAG
jgi:hypothetical protein